MLIRITMPIREYLEEFLPFRIGGNCTSFAVNPRTCRRILVKFFVRCVISVATNPLILVPIWITIRSQEFLTKFPPIRSRSNWRRFAISECFYHYILLLLLFVCLFVVVVVVVVVMFFYPRVYICGGSIKIKTGRLLMRIVIDKSIVKRARN